MQLLQGSQPLHRGEEQLGPACEDCNGILRKGEQPQQQMKFDYINY